MTKVELIEKLKTHAKTANIFGGRFISVSDDENYWSYHIPVVDALEPQIDLSTECFVIHRPNLSFDDKSFEKISYEDFITKYNLNRE